MRFCNGCCLLSAVRAKELVAFCKMTLQCWNMLLNTNEIELFSSGFSGFFFFFLLLNLNLIIEISLRTVMFFKMRVVRAIYVQDPPPQKKYLKYFQMLKQLLCQITCAANYQMLISITLLALTPIFRIRKQILRNIICKLVIC